MTVQKVKDLICHGKADLVGDAVRSTIDAGCDPEALLQGMVSAVDDLEERLEKGEILVPEMLLAVKAMKAGAAVIRPCLSAETISRLDRWLFEPRQRKFIIHGR